MILNCYAMGLLSSGVPVFIGLKVWPFVSFLSLALCLWNISPRPLWFILCLVYVSLLLLCYASIVMRYRSSIIWKVYFRSALSKSFFRVTTWSGFTTGSRISVHQENVFLIYEWLRSNANKLDLCLVIKYISNHHHSTILKGFL